MSTSGSTMALTTSALWHRHCHDAVVNCGLPGHAAVCCGELAPRFTRASDLQCFPNCTFQHIFNCRIVADLVPMDFFTDSESPSSGLSKRVISPKSNFRKVLEKSYCHFSNNLFKIISLMKYWFLLAFFQLPYLREVERKTRCSERGIWVQAWCTRHDCREVHHFARFPLDEKFQKFRNSQNYGIWGSL